MSVSVDAPRRVDDFEVRKLRHPWRSVAAVIVGLGAVGIGWVFATNPNMDWPTVGAYLFAELTIRGLMVTLYLTVVSMMIGLVGGTVVAIMTLSHNPVLRAVATTYVTIFRGIPVLVQIIFWGFIGAFFPAVTIGVPFTDVVFFSSPTSALINSTTAAILALGLNEAAYASEIVRAGIQSVDSGQREASSALGMNRATTMQRIILPQAMRVVVPPMGNEVISLLKTSALVSVIAGNDLMTNLQQVYAQNYKVIPLLVVASVWYLIVTTLLSMGQSQLEKRFGRGVTSSLPSRVKRVSR
jgi:polar amino acid transport system permease protein